MIKKITGILLTAAISLSSITAFASKALPDHQGTSMDNIEIGTLYVNSNVRQYFDLFKSAGDQFGVDPNLLAAICMQESSGRNLSYREDGSEYPAWGIMQIEYTMEKSFAEFGKHYAEEEWTLADRLVPEKAVPYAAWLISKSLIRYDCDYMKMIQAYNFGETVLDRIIDAKGEDWLSERANAASYASNWNYPTYGDAEYIEHVMRYYHYDIDYIGAKVRFNNELIDFDNQYPLIEDGYTFIPVRAVAETLGAEVVWDQPTQTATITNETTEIVLPINCDYAYVNGIKTELEKPAHVINNRTMVPLRFVAQALDLDVEWDGETRTIYIK